MVTWNFNWTIYTQSSVTPYLGMDLVFQAVLPRGRHILTSRLGPSNVGCWPRDIM